MQTVGVFDSGFGGLTALSCFQRSMPSVRFLYLGDNGNAPYGSRPEGEIREKVFSALKQFEGIALDALVLACNTATAVCAEELRKNCPFPVVGMEPAVRVAARSCKSAAVLCTPATAKSRRLRALCERESSCRFEILPAEGLAGEIERALSLGVPPDLSFLPKPPCAEGVVLGCTHYIFLKEQIESLYGMPAFDGNEGTARRLFSLLSKGKSPLGEEGSSSNHPTESDGNRRAPFPEFLGKWSELNEKIYKTNICFQNFGVKSKKNGKKWLQVVDSP